VPFISVNVPSSTAHSQSPDMENTDREKAELFCGPWESRGQCVRHPSSIAPLSDAMHRRHKVRWCTWFHRQYTDGHQRRQHRQEQRAQLKPMQRYITKLKKQMNRLNKSTASNCFF